MITIDTSELASFDSNAKVQGIESNFPASETKFRQNYRRLGSPPGVEAYRLLSYISTKFDNETLVDIGTRVGGAAIALAHNPNNEVLSYDIVDHSPPATSPNITFLIRDVLTDMIEQAKVLNSVFILFDIQPHNGTDELAFIDLLHNNRYGGLLMFDDIEERSEDLFSMWGQMPYPQYPKHDLTQFGHEKGTHILDFSKSLVVI